MYIDGQRTETMLASVIKLNVWGVLECIYDTCDLLTYTVQCGGHGLLL